MFFVRWVLRTFHFTNNSMNCSSLRMNDSYAEPIWRSLLAYVSKLFQPAFISANKIVSIQKAPKCHQLAEAITMGFLNHWEDKQPSSPLRIPYSSQQISDK
ncbi:hypothetical protein PSHT_02134 [Puccinia striiformis]|uniref:Uncharacterized protein n=1 Tax=Puccinia striiformis TaxID=27350 RepID=A0A2S4WIK7_9BASI|nr:hypothetical protein PSHT_02134 [Puccinia striiformis]